MKIVIDIDEEIYNFVQNTSFVEDESTLFKQTNAERQKTLFLFDIIDAIRNGEPLPEHHGRLIDVDELHHKMGEWLKLSQKADESVMVALDDIVISTMMEIEETPTIIEADRGE